MLANPLSVPVRNLRAQPVHVVVVAFDSDNVRLIDRRAEYLGRLEVIWNEDVTGEPEPRGVCRHAAREIPRGCAAEHREPELDGTA